MDMLATMYTSFNRCGLVSFVSSAAKEMRYSFSLENCQKKLNALQSNWLSWHAHFFVFSFFSLTLRISIFFFWFINCYTCFFFFKREHTLQTMILWANRFSFEKFLFKAICSLCVCACVCMYAKFMPKKLFIHYTLFRSETCDKPKTTTTNNKYDDRWNQAHAQAHIYSHYRNGKPIFFLKKKQPLQHQWHSKLAKPIVLMLCTVCILFNQKGIEWIDKIKEEKSHHVKRIRLFVQNVK